MQFAGQNQQRDHRHMHSTGSRRSFLKQIVGVGAAGLFLPGLLAACRNENTAAASSTETAPGIVGGSCAESEAIPLTAVATRKAVAYVDLSLHAERRCDNCRFFKQPATGASCGGCEIVGGTIAPAGYCTAWAAM
ncbi:MAG: high-potential iron-sulfur protein [Caldilineaceae bacterium]|nr:high-potential iron-sulfur protein [Caldilineaceae bacterium]